MHESISARRRNGKENSVPTLYFLPWCRLRCRYIVGEIELSPVRSVAAPQGPNPSFAPSVVQGLQHFVDLDDAAVHEVTAVRLKGGEWVGELTPESEQALRECLAVACFAALACRDFEQDAGQWSNADCFQLYAYELPSDPARTETLRVSRRDGIVKVLAGYPAKYHRPVHTASADSIAIDVQLAQALAAFRDRAIGAGKQATWEQMLDAILVFNRANSDARYADPRDDWVMMSSAFQRLLGRPTKALDDATGTAQEFRGIIEEPANEVGADLNLIEEWLREFCRIRGAFAHGRRLPGQPQRWDYRSHLLSAAISFPLLVRFLLEKEGLYSRTITDRAALAALPEFLQQRTQNTARTEWWQLCLHRKLEVAIALGLKERAETSTGG
jgi:hypothetical protein